MSRPALFSYEGALRVLGKYDRPWLDKADTFLGVSILVGGAVEPSIFSLVDPKNEATSCLRKILDGVTDKLTGLSGTHRHELIAAAHTIIVVTSVFEAFNERLGKYFDKLEVTDSEKFRILHAKPPHGRKEISAIPALTSIAAPMPSATRGFYENIDARGALREFLAHAILDVHRFLNKLANRPDKADTSLGPTLIRAREIYFHHYLGIAAAIPEFRIWALLGEHAATRARFEQGHAELSRELTAARTESLELFARLMAQLSPEHSAPSQKFRKSFKDLAEAVLHRPIIGSNIDPSSVEAVFPTVEDGFIVPGYRLAVYDGDTVASSGAWWNERTEVRNDLDVFLAAHLAGPGSTAGPLLVLGNPGAGKSLLMEVLAARLPEDQFTVVLVPLRKVRAEDRVHDQIETALRPVLGKGVDWEELAEACGDSVPVILLDGFDELIQASGVQQSTYLQQVKEFQQQQAVLGRPVAVVITSRMLVADRARIPIGVPIVKLEEFDDGRIERWLNTWNTTNINTQGFHLLDLAALSHHKELARQPLLLLMLAIYAADPSQPPLNDENLSNSELYRRLIAMFVARQVGQKGREPLAPALVEQGSAESAWRLGIAALAMFNRGHQYVTATELNDDLAVFAPKQSTRSSTTFDIPIDDADRTVENFFFIHSPARNDGATAELRTYEFLHSTFGEYLIAEVTIKLLRQLAAAQALPTANPYQLSAPPDDSLLYALISHQAFIKRKPIIEFARGLFSTLPDGERDCVLRTLDDLIQACQHRPPNDPYLAYRPAASTIITRIARYSANLVCLRVLLDEDVPTSIADLFGQDHDSPLAGWRATVHLWKSGLDEESWNEVISRLTLLEADAWFIVRERDDSTPAVQEARLLGDPALEMALHAGELFISSDATTNRQEQSLVTPLVHLLLSASACRGTERTVPDPVRTLYGILDSLDTGTRMNINTANLLALALSRDASKLPREVVERALGHLVPRTKEEIDTAALTGTELVSILCAHPDLVDSSRVSPDLLSRMFAQWSGAAMNSVILVWATSNSSDSRVNDAFRDFARVVEQTAAPYIGRAMTTYLPIEAFEYLAEPRTVEPAINESLLNTLNTNVAAAADEVSPPTILRLIERFSDAVPESRTAEFVSRYLEGRTLEVSADEQAAMERLRELAG
ncbi:NACHT domain-containing protein [Lentzea sp. HUAS TT2]|uniref:NACHT domain-containing protein n=1 Tax=Lentzea sp. HUAS TT2 TaxID=3447454 RepID=UPI003F7283A1